MPLRCGHRSWSFPSPGEKGQPAGKNNFTERGVRCEVAAPVPLGAGDNSVDPLFAALCFTAGLSWSPPGIKIQAAGDALPT
jgi:hypothetical protein